MSISDQLSQNGYVMLASGELDTAALLVACQQPTTPIKRQKSFLGSLAVSQAIRDEVRRLGVEPHLVQYLGPGVGERSVELYISAPGDTARHRSGQLWHLDIDAVPQVKLFFLCRPTSQENGPTTFLSVADSQQIQAATGYIPGQSLPDEAVVGYTPMQLVGPAGTALLIDTSRCLHMGSRVIAGERVVLVVQYT